MVERAKDALDIGIVSADGARLAAFYLGALGFEAQPDLELEIGRIRRLRWGRSVLRILEPRDGAHGSPAGQALLQAGFRYLALEVADLNGTLDACIAAGATPVVGPTSPRPGRIVAQFRDPDGNLIELGQGS